MTPENLREPVTAILLCPGDDFKGHMAPVQELLDHIAELTRQRDDARRIAIDSGVFQNTTNEEYLLAEHLAKPVAWDAQVQQR